MQRTKAWNEREYGREKWPAVEALIEDAIAAGERDLTRVLALTVRRERRLTDAGLALQSACLMGSRTQLPSSLVAAAHDALVAESVIAACRPGTGLIVELGAGWGLNLATVWLSGGPMRAPYVAAEVTESGRRTVERLASLAYEFDLRAVPYDFEDPELDQLPRATHAVVFTCHGIGQVPRLPRAAIDAVIALAPEVTCVHVEPIGWQVRGEPQSEAARYADEHDYNRNLWQLLTSAETSGNLTIDQVDVDVVGGNPKHPSSLVVWRSSVS